jgi:hypothetical protein
MNIDVNELISEIGRLHIQIILLQKAYSDLQSQFATAKDVTTENIVQGE